eukprot:1136972-Pelagomonas_calceolata.AAC.2
MENVFVEDGLYTCNLNTYFDELPCVLEVSRRDKERLLMPSLAACCLPCTCAPAGWRLATIVNTRRAIHVQGASRGKVAGCTVMH